MTSPIRFDPIRLPAQAQALREEVRNFLRAEIAAGTFDPRTADRESGFNPAFSRRMGERGWIGMTWPRRYGGHERSFLERYVVTEECRVANAPMLLHFTADRQSGPVLLKYAGERIKSDILPRITRGECCFCIGMSEPGSGSDLFAARRDDYLGYGGEVQFKLRENWTFLLGVARSEWDSNLDSFDRELTTWRISLNLGPVRAVVN